MADPPSVEVRDGVDPATRRAVGALGDAASAEDGEAVWSDRARLALATDPADDGASTPVLLLAGSPHDATDATPAGAGILLPDPEAWGLEIVVHPERHDERNDDGHTFEDRIMDHAVAVASDRGAVALRLWMAAPSPRRIAMAERFGFSPERELHQLRVPLPLTPAAAPSSAVAVRAFEPGRDEAAWLVANNRAFADHPEQGRWRLADLEAREHEPWFEPAGFLLHEAEGRVAAFCWTKVHRDTQPVLGEIYVIGVDPDFQGRGLGRALTVAGLAHLAKVGIRQGMLYVDGSNTAARALYRSLGFTTHHVDRAYLRRLAGGPAQKPETPTTRPMP